jgi:hypothetical protein
MSLRRLSEYGGYIAGVVLIAFGVVAIFMGVNGRNEVREQLKAQKITAGADAAEITNGALEEGMLIDTGAKAREFAKVMEAHTLDATGGKRYAEMGRFLTPDGKDTNDEALAAKTEDGRPVENSLRNLWVTETALTTALNMSYMAEQVALFGMVVGVALLLTGIGFIVIAVAGALRAPKEQATLTSAKVAAA